MSDYQFRADSYTWYRATLYNEIKKQSNGIATCAMCMTELDGDMMRITLEYEVSPQQNGSLDLSNLKLLHSKCVMSFRRLRQ